MANSAPARKRVGDYNPDVETGEILDSIAGSEVEIAGVSFDRRNGKNGRYTLSIIELVDGTLYHTGSPVVAERLASLYGLNAEQLAEQLDSGAPSPAAPADVFPVTATFTKVQSQNDKTRSYWSVS